MEQVLSSPRGHSDWESDQNSLGFLLLDNDDVIAASSHENPERHQRGEPGIVSVSFDEIFQDTSLNLDELFRASRYSGLNQAYPWERSSDSVSPSWDKPQSLPQKLAEGDCYETPHNGVTADLITFKSSEPSPTHACASVQAVDISQPIGTVDMDCSLDGLIGQLPLDSILNQTLSQTLPARRTSVVEESPDSHWTKDLTSSQTTPENVTDLLCANLQDLAGESSSRIASCNFETSLEVSIPPNDPVVQELESDFAQAVLLLSSTFVPEQAAPVESTSTSPISLFPHTDFLPEYSNDELCMNAHRPEIDAATETSRNSNENSNLSVICGSHADDIHNQKPLASEKETIVDTFLALEKEPPPISPSICLTLEANAETDSVSLDDESQTHTSSEIGSKYTPSESTNLLEDMGKEQTINMPKVDILEKNLHTLAAVETHFLLHVQEVASVHTSVKGTTQHCQDTNGCTGGINQQPNTQDVSESFCFLAHNCTPEKCVNPQDSHITSDDLQDPNPLTESCCVNIHTPDSTPVPEENTHLCVKLPAPGSPKAEVEKEGRDSELDNVTHAFESVPGPLDSTLLSGADSPLSQVGMAMEQERGEATSRLSQSPDVRVDRESDLPDQLTQADLSQVAEPRVNSLKDESPSRVDLLEETCPPLMEDNGVVVVVPDSPNNAEMALELCVSSDVKQDGSVGARALPAASHQDEDHTPLRAVFQALDQDGDGFVRIEEFMDFATAYGVEQVMSLSLFINVCT